MARIRSVHPGLATDARFVVLSDAAQIFFVILLTVADDAGVFRWEPLELQMQVRPASPLSVEPLLDELVAGNFLCRFEADGNAYGAIRNFCRFQSPKSPTRRYPLPQTIFPYVGLKSTLEVVPRKKKNKQKQSDESQLPKLSGTVTEGVPNTFPSTSEALLPGRERGRDYREGEWDGELEWERDKEKERESLVERTSLLPREAEPHPQTRPSPKILKKVKGSEAEPRPAPSEIPEGWLAEAEAAREEAELEPVNLLLEWGKFAARAEGAVEQRRWIEWALRAWVSREVKAKASGAPSPEAVAETPWATRMRNWRDDGFWLPMFGPKPGQPGCFVPPEFLAEAAE